MVQFDLLPSPQATPGTSPALRPRGEELSLSTCPGLGNRPPKKIPGGISGRSMVTGQIELCINYDKHFDPSLTSRLKISDIARRYGIKL